MALLNHFTIWFTSSLISVAILSFLLLKKYAFATASTTIKILTFIGWFLGFATIALLPLDIALAD